MVLCCGLKLAPGCVGSGFVWERLWCKPRSAAAYARPRASGYEIQSDLQMITTFAGLRGAWKRLSCEPSLAGFAVSKSYRAR